ncbi:MAG: M14 family zinc carboxypeptidase [Bacteroidota bacterium]
MKNLLLSICLFLFTSFLLAETPVKYSRIKIFITDQNTLDKVWKSGVDYEGSTGKLGGFMEFVAGKQDLTRLSQNGISYSIVTDDLAREYAKGLRRGPQNALGFGYGSMGGYYTYAEVVQQLDSMKHQFPSLITSRQSIGKSIEGRDLWMVKISSNPDVNDPTKPEVLYTGVHHAREPEGMMATIYYMWWLLENYGTDPEATYLVNNRQIWFLPVVNPDGYVYNQTTYPGGGGMWRKNRRLNSNGYYGVDLNRNYGSYEMWNSSYGGSDPYPYTYSDVYRGLTPFSEPETQAISGFLSLHNIKTCLNYHTYGNDIIYPWGYLPWESDDSLTFRAFAFDITGYNRYINGIDWQTVHYTTRGTSDDYMYGDYSKPITFAMTPEIGLGTFWPPTDSILPYAAVNLEPNKYISFVAGQYTTTKGMDVVDQNHDGGIESGETFSLTVTLKNKGLGNTPNIFVNLSATNPGIEWSVANDTINIIPALGEGQASFAGRRVGFSGNSNSFIITITDENGYLHRDTIKSPLGAAFTLFADSANNGMSNWSTGVSGWGLTDSAHTPPYAFTDSPFGDYQPFADNSLTMVNPLNLTGYNYTILKFWTKWAVEPIFDFATVEVSSNSGGTWTSLKSSLSHGPSGNGVQTGGWGYDGYNPGMTWVEQEIDLSPYSGSNILIRFRLISDGVNERDGIYIDDIRVIGYRDTTSTGVFVLNANQRWNLISLPVIVADGSKGNVFPSAISSAYRYENPGGYIEDNSLVPGSGYWLKFGGAEHISILGTINNPDTIDVQPGWNLIGSISMPIATSDVGSDPPGMIVSPFFQFTGGKYTQSDTIDPGQGHWVKVNQAGELILSASKTMAGRNRVQIVNTGEFPPPPPAGGSVVNALPLEFRLEQNYPNPFNPTTTINYALPNDVFVTLKVYNMLGQEIATLVNGKQDAGYKSVKFDMPTISSGIYIYRLNAGTFSDVKKMIIIK